MSAVRGGLAVRMWLRRGRSVALGMWLLPVCGVSATVDESAAAAALELAAPVKASCGAWELARSRHGGFGGLDVLERGELVGIEVEDGPPTMTVGQAGGAAGRMETARLTREVVISDGGYGQGGQGRKGDPAGDLVVDETVVIAPGEVLRERVVVTVPLLRMALPDVAQIEYPQRDGRRLVREAATAECAAFRIGTDAIAGGCVALALPVIEVLRSDGRRIAVMADPYWATTFTLERIAGELRIGAGFAAPGAQVPYRGQQRSFRIIVHDGGFERAVSAFFAAHSPARGPAWTRNVKLVYFDYLSDSGHGWQRDLEALAARIAPAHRDQVAVALHGWYDLIGAYSFDAGSGRFLDSWRAQKKRDGGVAMSVAEVRRRLEQARALGFRTLLYFADGMIADRKTAMGARASDELGRSTWNGPEVEGELIVQNPADPAVRRWFLDYTAAVLENFGDRLDGLVWDETFWIRSKATVTVPEPAHADVAMMSLMRLIADRVHRFQPNLALLASDTIGHEGIDVPPYAIMAHGTFQDAESNPLAWSFGLFPAWDAPLWSVNWGARIRFDDTRTGVLRFAAPVSLSNGWADDLGPSEMTAEWMDRAIALFDWSRARHAPRPRWIETEPAEFLRAPLAGELATANWRVLPATGDAPPGRDDPGWLPARPDALRYLDANLSLGAAVNAAWAAATVNCPGNVRVTLNAGSHGPIRVWIDGREVLHSRQVRRHSAGVDRTGGLDLGPGEHRLLVRIERQTSGFGFSLRIDGPLP